MRTGGALHFLPLLAFAACSKPMAKIEALRDVLVADEPAAITSTVASYAHPEPQADPNAKPGSAEAAAYLAGVATALGSKKGFIKTPPDHAGASTAAVVLLHDARTDWLGDADTWLGDLKSAKGVGHDVLRLATAKKMADAAPVIGKKIDDEATARAATMAVYGAIPGACTTYGLVGAKADAKSGNVPPELDPDHSACVQKDLSRREGPGGTYGTGVFRAMEGALSLWRETERALRVGLPLAEPGAKTVLEKKLAVIEAATKLIETKKQTADDASSNAVMAAMRAAHADAGVALTKDAGADATAAAAAVAPAAPSAPPSHGR